MYKLACTDGPIRNLGHQSPAGLDRSYAGRLQQPLSQATRDVILELVRVQA